MTPLDLDRLTTCASSKQPLTVELAPMIETDLHDDADFTNKTIVLQDPIEERAGYIIFTGVTVDNNSPVTLTWFDSFYSDQQITLELQTA